MEHRNFEEVRLDALEAGIELRKIRKLAVIFPGIGYRTDKPLRDGRVRETRSRDLMPGDVVAFWSNGKATPSGIWVKDEVGLVERTADGFRRVPEARVTALLATDRFQAFRPAAE